MAEDNLNNNTDGTGDTNDNTSDGNNTQPAWMAQLPDDLKANEVLTKFETIGDLGKNFLDLQGKTENTIPKIREDATDEEKAAFWAAIGRPESPDGYEFEKIEIPDGIPYDEEGEMKFRKFAHEIGLTTQQGKDFHKWYLNNLIESHAELDKTVKEIENKAIETLKGKWGQDYDANLEMAKRGFDKAGELAGKKDEFVQFMNDSQLGNNPLFIEIFHAIGKAMSEDTSGDTHLDAKKEEVKRDVFGHTEMSFPNTPGME